MTMHIEELVCNVTATLGTAALPPAAAAPGVGIVADEAPPPPLEQVLPRAITSPEAEQIVASTVARQTAALVAEGAAAPGIDPQALADRVYRLMREELEIARERE